MGDRQHISFIVYYILHTTYYIINIYLVPKTNL